MNSHLLELDALRNPQRVLRISYQQDVPLTKRISSLIDTPAFYRLRHLSQLGLVARVYPSAHHTRFEHSLGVYHLALRYLQHFLGFPDFARTVTTVELETFLLAALLHDIGHWPYCHPIEDMALPELASHEQRATEIICESEISEKIAAQWSCTADDVARFLTGNVSTASEQLLYSMLSSPVDIDKMDYLQRDSLHAGVPYGHNFDQQRLLLGLIADPTTNQLALNSKSLTAAEMMVFARYVMFSEVYWHKTVRSATAMLQCCVQKMPGVENIQTICSMNDSDAERYILDTTEASTLASDLFGPIRKLHKSVFECNATNNPDIYHRVVGLSHFELLAASHRLQELMNCGSTPYSVLIDAPPTELEVQFDLNVYDKMTDDFTPLSDRSPVVRVLAEEQFDYHVKRVRIFVRSEFAHACRSRENLAELLLQSVSS
jgi:HD superfamily phosphohydrolase|tara:strand:+ start:2197 stop:3495 length:1299 start_codon:yes stop_codon:yes gene_type:complete